MAAGYTRSRFCMQPWFSSVLPKLPDEEKMQQEKRSLQQIGDSFKKIVIVGDRMKLRRDEQGIVLMGIYEFLSDKTLLDA